MNEEQTKVVEAVEEKAAEVVEAVTEKSEAVMETVKEKVGAVAEAIQEKAAAVIDAADEKAEEVTKKIDESPAAEAVASAGLAEEPPVAAPEEPVESMDDLKADLEKSYQEYDQKGTRKFVENDSPDAEKWQELKQMQDDKTVVKVKIKEIVKGGAIAFVNETRAFIPASQISLGYVEKLEDWVGKTLETYIITVDPEKKRLVLSARELLRERRDAERKAKMEAYKPGAVVEGVVESLKDYGAFVKLDEGVTGLLHVSQISRQRIKHPSVVLQEGQTVKVKIRDVANGKISLTMRNMDEEAPREEKSDFHYKNSAAVTTGLGDLLKGLKF